jgi:hypothetical protein
MPVYYYTCGTQQDENVHCVRSNKNFAPLDPRKEYSNICFFKIDTKDLDRPVTRDDSMVILLRGTSKFDTLELYNLCVGVKTS